MSTLFLCESLVCTVVIGVIEVWSCVYSEAVVEGFCTCSEKGPSVRTNTELYQSPSEQKPLLIVFVY